MSWLETFAVAFGVIGGSIKNNTVGLKGVTRQRGRYHARIRCGGVTHCLGLFETATATHAAYAAKAAELFGEFARIS